MSEYVLIAVSAEDAQEFLAVRGDADKDVLVITPRRLDAARGRTARVLHWTDAAWEHARWQEMLSVALPVTLHHRRELA
jgi:hypothetical protein